MTEGVSGPMRAPGSHFESFSGDGRRSLPLWACLTSKLRSFDAGRGVRCARQRSKSQIRVYTAVPRGKGMTGLESSIPSSLHYPGVNLSKWHRRRFDATDRSSSYSPGEVDGLMACCGAYALRVQEASVY
jgi:hypothetical protein